MGIFGALAASTMPHMHPQATTSASPFVAAAMIFVIALSSLFHFSGFSLPSRDRTANHSSKHPAVDSFPAVVSTILFVHIAYWLLPSYI
ncbi:hypothetical protein PILCRDRAFT_192751 [Piloderma croceum F 1598]|uniref:Uncharacterized protein n=1 Tax=Piloderma croceum (strain F 1598) TaxID=765440 RepID=A0A0C3GD99_PILCF|nr:hypothetical protein PILCRDRAFT_192751 [Piloderma croceum F 1598]